MSEDTAKKTDEAVASKPPAKAKKEKPPAPEDKPFADFIQQDYIPALGKALAGKGIEDMALSLENQAIPVVGLASDPCWQVVGRWKQNQRQFQVYFLSEDIKGQRGFSCADNGSTPAVLEPFLCDERRINLDLLVLGVVQRLNGQKWLTRN